MVIEVKSTFMDISEKNQLKYILAFQSLVQFSVILYHPASKNPFIFPFQHPTLKDHLWLSTLSNITLFLFPLFRFLVSFLIHMYLFTPLPV